MQVWKHNFHLFFIMIVVHTQQSNGDIVEKIEIFEQSVVRWSLVLLEVHEQLPSPLHKYSQRALGGLVLVVLAQVVRHIAYLLCEHCHCRGPREW